MPVIKVEMLEGRSVEQKRELVAVFTRELARICGTSPQAINVVIDEVRMDNWGVGGELLSDRAPSPRS